LRFSVNDVAAIRVIPVNEAIQSGLMNRWLDVMLDGLMGKVNSDWQVADHENDLLSEITTSNDKALLYYILCHVGAGRNWSDAFARAKTLLDADGMDKFKDMKQVKKAIGKIIAKENMIRATTYAFADRRVEDSFAPIVGHVKTTRATLIGKAWDRHLITIYISRCMAAKARIGDQPIAQTSSASKRAEDRISKKNNLATMMGN
jgi:hypothetical protein